MSAGMSLGAFADGFASGRAIVKEGKEREKDGERQDRWLTLLEKNPNLISMGATADVPGMSMGGTYGGGGQGGGGGGGGGVPSGALSYRDAIASIESAGSGDYAAVGATNAKLGRPLGRYQIMEANIGPWSQEALGLKVTADEFLADPKLQDAIFDHKFGGYVQKYGPEGAAQAWLGGPGAVGKTGRKDVHGTSVGSYGQRFVKAIGGGPARAPDPSMGALPPAY